MKFLKRNTETNNLRRYLLGQLSGAQQEKLEKRLMTDSVLNEELVATEDDLVDEYLSKRLNDAERRQFESFFSVTDERQRKVRFGRILRTYLASLSVADSQGEIKVDSRPRVFSGLLARTPILVASMLLVFTGVFAVSWLAYRRQTHRTPKQTIAITLQPGLFRSEGAAATQRLQRPPLGSTLRVELELGTNEFQTYQIEFSKENSSLATFVPLKAEPKEGHFVLNFDIDSRLLDAGDYGIKVSGISGSGEAEFKDQYHFRVIP